MCVSMCVCKSVCLFQCQVIPAVVGPTIFFRTLYKYVYSTEFKFEFVVVGRDVDTVRTSVSV